MITPLELRLHFSFQASTGVEAEWPSEGATESSPELSAQTGRHVLAETASGCKAFPSFDSGNHLALNQAMVSVIYMSTP